MSTTNQGIKFKGNPAKIIGTPLQVGKKAPTATLTANDLSDLDTKSFAGKVLIVSVVPSLDTPVCSTQTKRFNSEAGKLGDKVAVLTVSVDLPFAQKRWCGAEGADHVITASDYKHRQFGENFGTYLPDIGLLCRAVFVIDKDQTVQYVEYVDEITDEPNYDPVLAKVQELV